MNWFHLLDLDFVYSTRILSFEEIRTTNLIENQVNIAFERIEDQLIDFCDSNLFSWNHERNYDKIDKILKDKIESYDFYAHINLKYLNEIIRSHLNKIKEQLLKICQAYISEYFAKEDSILYRSKLALL